jgi:hypothetical protein
MAEIKKKVTDFVTAPFKIVGGLCITPFTAFGAGCVGIYNKVAGKEGNYPWEKTVDWMTVAAKGFSDLALIPDVIGTGFDNIGKACEATVNSFANKVMGKLKDTFLEKPVRFIGSLLNATIKVPFNLVKGAVYAAGTVISLGNSKTCLEGMDNAAKECGKAFNQLSDSMGDSRIAKAVKVVGLTVGAFPKLAYNIVKTAACAGGAVLNLGREKAPAVQGFTSGWQGIKESLKQCKDAAPILLATATVVVPGLNVVVLSALAVGAIVDKGQELSRGKKEVPAKDTQGFLGFLAKPFRALEKCGNNLLEAHDQSRGKLVNKPNTHTASTTPSTPTVQQTTATQPTIAVAQAQPTPTVQQAASVAQPHPSLPQNPALLQEARLAASPMLIQNGAPGQNTQRQVIVQAQPHTIILGYNTPGNRNNGQGQTPNMS